MPEDEGKGRSGMENGYIIGIDIGGTNIRAGASSARGELTHFQRAASQRILTGSESVENLTAFIRGYVAEALGNEPVEAIAVGLPSVLNRERDVVVQTPNIAGLDGVPLKRILEEALETRVFIERDVNLLFCNDMEAFHIDPRGVNIGVYIGTGIGNSIFIDGKPLVGKDGAAGELGHVYTGRKGKICGCGNEGCTECFAAGRYLVELRDARYPGEDMTYLFTNHGADAQLREFVENVAAVCAAEINILNPETVVLGGGVIGMKDFPRDQLVADIHRFARKPFPERSLQIFFSMDAVENGVRGAIEFARMKMGI